MSEPKKCEHGYGDVLICPDCNGTGKAEPKCGNCGMIKELCLCKAEPQAGGLEDVIFDHVRDMSGCCKELRYDHKTGKHGMTFQININQKELARAILSFIKSKAEGLRKGTDYNGQYKHDYRDYNQAIDDLMKSLEE